MKKITKHFLALALLGTSTAAFAQTNPIELGRSSNIFSVLRTEQNQIFTDDSSKLVAFIHRHDVTIYGGGNAENGKLRYDFSADGGLSFTNDVGPLNQTYTRPTRYPQITGFDLSGTTDPNNILLPWVAPTQSPAPDWDGFASGLSDVNSNPTSTEAYNEVGANALLEGGLCEGLPGEFWTTSIDYYSGTSGDSIFIYKGDYNGATTDIDWAKHSAIGLNHDLTYDGASKMIGPNMSFSPNGMIGWTAVLGDLVGGPTHTFNPVFVKSSDGGVTWGVPTEVDLNNIPFVGDYPTLAEELQALWVDSSGAAVGTGVASCAFDYDITVDANGNPHMFVVVANGSTTTNTAPTYSVYSGLVKIALDVTSDDGGATWKAIKIAPIYAFRGNWGLDGTTSQSVDMDNFPQISRTESGSHIFYSWADSDTTFNFGDSDNLMPNLRIAGLRVADGFQTCPKWITLGDPFWDGLALFPTMAPEVLTNSGSTADYNLPIVMASMLSNNCLEPTKFWYFGNDATFLESDFNDIATIVLDSCVVASDANLVESKISKFSIAPNPTNGMINIDLSEVAYGEIDFIVINSMGQVVRQESLNNKTGSLNADLSDLENGIYVISIITAEGDKLTSRMVKM